MRYHADAGGIDKQLVGSALVYHLGIAGDDLHAGGIGRRLHRCDDAPQIVDRETLFDNHAAGQIQRHRAAHGKIIDRAGHRQLADIASGKEQRIDHIGIGRHGQRAAEGVERIKADACLVFEGCQGFVGKAVDEHIVDQVAHRLAAGAVRQRDCFAFQARFGCGVGCTHAEASWRCLSLRLASSSGRLPKL